MNKNTVPADVRAARNAVRADSCTGNPCSDGYPDCACDRRATAALAASDAVRLAGAGGVVERLAAICGPSMQQCQCRSDQADCDACTCGRAAALITTLRATIARLVAERDAARETALREAAETARKVMLSEDCSASEAHGRMAQAIACAEAILALLTKEPAP